MKQPKNNSPWVVPFLYKIQVHSIIHVYFIDLSHAHQAHAHQHVRRMVILMRPNQFIVSIQKSHEQIRGVGGGIFQLYVPAVFVVEELGRLCGVLDKVGGDVVADGG